MHKCGKDFGHQTRALQRQPFNRDATLQGGKKLGSQDRVAHVSGSREAMQ